MQVWHVLPPCHGWGWLGVQETHPGSAVPLSPSETISPASTRLQVIHAKNGTWHHLVNSSLKRHGFHHAGVSTGQRYCSSHSRFLWMQQGQNSSLHWFDYTSPDLHSVHLMHNWRYHLASSISHISLPFTLLWTDAHGPMLPSHAQDYTRSL